MAKSVRFLEPFLQGLLVPATQNLLLIRPVDPTGFSEIPSEGLVLEQGFKLASDALQSSGFTVLPRTSQRHAMTVVFLTRSKQENLANIARASRITDGPVLVDGAKTDGIESVLKQVKQLIEVEGVISKSHGKVFWFTAGPTLSDWEKQGEPSMNSAGFTTAPGMFSSEKIDHGSALLAPHLRGLSGAVADFGAGWGWLSHMALAQNPDIKGLDLYEADFQALEAAKLNIVDPRARFSWMDIQTMAATTNRFDSIICNPPFHHSRNADAQIGIEFITRAAAVLARKGRLYMVANQHLPYEAVLIEQFKTVKILQKTSGFKLFLATTPRQK